ncbi:MAG: TatD family hydrolase [Planctomycetota bacterium]
MIDTHCHLTFPDYAGRLSEELDLAAEHGVTGAITIATTTTDSLQTLALAEADRRVWCTAGVHPLYSDRGPHDWSNVERVGRSDRCVGFGELGLDYHYDEPTRETQHAVLAEQLAFLGSLRSEGGEPAFGKPVVVHCRKAFGDLVPILRGSGLPGDRFVFHCFTGTPDDARLALDLGASISFTGVVTYKNAPEVRAAAQIVPGDRVMVETDAPFLSPEPRRGERPCRPWMTSLTARFLADLRGEAWDSFHAMINENTSRFFGIDAA